jgi:8-oxo-dGTP diphosphatase
MVPSQEARHSRHPPAHPQRASKEAAATTMVHIMRKVFTTSVFLTHESPEGVLSVLLVHHKRFNLWLPVGGELWPGETPLEGAIREVKEETGIHLVANHFPVGKDPMPFEPLGFLGYEEHDAGSRGLHMNFIFEAHCTTDQVRLCDEHSAYQWLLFPTALVYSREGLMEKLPTTANVAYCLDKIIASWTGKSLPPAST